MAQAQEMENDLKNSERNHWVLAGSAAGGVLLCIPILILERRLLRKKSKPTVISADHLEASDIAALQNAADLGKKRRMKFCLS